MRGYVVARRAFDRWWWPEAWFPDARTAKEWLGAQVNMAHAVVLDAATWEVRATADRPYLFAD